MNRQFLIVHMLSGRRTLTLVEAPDNKLAFALFFICYPCQHIRKVKSIKDVTHLPELVAQFY